MSFWLSDLSTTGVPIDILDPNRVEFDPAGLFSADPTKEFKLGKLTFENGTWTGDADLGLWIDVFDSTNGAHYHFEGFVHMALTPNTGTADENTDYVYFTDANGLALEGQNAFGRYPLGSLRVCELGDSPLGNIASADVYATTGSLDLTRLANFTGAGFLDSSTITALSTPEPGSLGLLGTALLITASLRLAGAQAARRRGLNVLGDRAASPHIDVAGFGLGDCGIAGLQWAICISARVSYDRFLLVLSAAGLRGIRFHDLRHTFGSMLIQAGPRSARSAIRCGTVPLVQ